MKIKTAELDYSLFEKLEKEKPFRPKKPNLFFRTLLKVVAQGDLKTTGFTLTEEGTEKIEKKQPCLYLMNHSSFIDLKIASSILYPRPFNIICTSDGFVGKKWLMRELGCIPTQKFVTDLTLVKNMVTAVKKLNSSILMYPEASYTFDGTATPLPSSIGKCVKLLGVPVVTILTDGAFLRDPLYNNLQLRKVKVSARMKYLLSPEEIRNLSTEEINEVIGKEFSFDNFRSQQENGIVVNEPFRADFLHRVLYKCPACQTEGKTEGEGTVLTCHTCGKKWELTENGYMKSLDGETEFPHIPDWYRWERDCVRNELETGDYHLSEPVIIRAIRNYDAVYTVGEGVLTHSVEGFRLTGCNGKLDYFQPPEASYSLYSDYYWYELGDMVCIGTGEVLYYCFPKETNVPVAKTRLAAEELFKLKKNEKNR